MAIYSPDFTERFTFLNTYGKSFSYLKLTFSYDKAPASGDNIGNIKVKADSSEFYVESAEYTNSDDQDTWTVGED